MYEDNPGWKVYFNLLKAMYHEHPIRIDIVGTIDSIKAISKELLYTTYETFTILPIWSYSSLET